MASNPLKGQTCIDTACFSSAEEGYSSLAFNQQSVQQQVAEIQLFSYWLFLKQKKTSLFSYLSHEYELSGAA